MTPAAPPPAATALVAAVAGGTPFPGPGAWDGRAWAGAAIYALLFAASLRVVGRLCRDSPDGETGR